MKSSSTIRRTRASLSAGLLFAAAAALPAQSGSVISARPGQRTSQPFPAPEADGMHLSLDQAVALAVANNQDLNVSVNAAEASQFFLFQNMGIYDPLVTANASRAHTDTPASSSLSGAAVSTSDTFDAGAQISQLTPWGGTYSLGFTGNRTATNSTFFFINPSYQAHLTLGVSQPLLRNFGKRPTNILIDTARNSRDATYQLFVRSVQVAIDAVEQAYWDLVYARENLKVKKEARDIAGELNRITRIKIDVGSLAPIDIVQTEVGIATAEQDIINAEAAVGLAEDQLKRQLNFEATAYGATRIIPTDQIRAENEKQAFDLSEGVRGALARRPEITAQNYTVSSQQLRYEYWQNQTLPQLDLVGGYGRSGLDGKVTDPETHVVVANNGFSDAASQVFNENFKDWRIGLVFSYPILNRQAKGARGVAKFNLETDKARLTVLEQDIIVNVRNAHRAIVTASRQIDAAAKGRELAERNLDAARKKYDNGMTTSFEVSQIQVQLSDARSKELNALAIYRKAISAYHSAIADILEWKGVKIEGMPEMAPAPEVRADLVRRALEPVPASP
jgi:outer membrane protein TolC